MKRQARRALLRRLRDLEIPDCSCKPPALGPFCTLFGQPCPTRQATGSCDCALVREWCEHVRRFRKARTWDAWEEEILELYERLVPGRHAPAECWDQWRELLWELHPKDPRSQRCYREASLPPAPARLPTQADRVRVMAWRYERGYSLHHPADVTDEENPSARSR